MHLANKRPDQKTQRESKVHASLCPLNFLREISMRHDAMNHFHIKVPLLGFKSSITHVTLGKLKQGNALTQTTLPQ